MAAFFFKDSILCRASIIYSFTCCMVTPYCH